MSIWSPILGDRALDATSSSTQSAGVGGTGPKVDTAWEAVGRRVGGDTTGAGERVILCDLELACGGGPGGGGGRGIPGAHLAIDNPRLCVAAGEELIAPADAALREAGGLTGASYMSTSCWTCSTLICPCPLEAAVWSTGICTCPLEAATWS